VKAFKFGAYDFITKHFDIETILIVVKTRGRIYHCQSEKYALKQLQKNKIYFEEFIGESEEIRTIKNLIVKLAAHGTCYSDYGGKPGQGKNILAQQIHFTLSAHP
jgi:DNA-binding NtrC family response regulator